MAVHKEADLPAVTAQWAGLLPTAAGHPIVPPAADPVSLAAAAGVADWPLCHQMLAQELTVNAMKMAGAAGQTNITIDSADEMNAATITRS